MSENAATSLRDTADALITSVVQAVVPEAKVGVNAADGGPLSCTSPASGVYYTLYRTFDVPSGFTVDTLIPQLGSELARRGFRVEPVETQPTLARVQARTDTEGVMVVGFADSGVVNIIFDTACGHR